MNGRRFMIVALAGLAGVTGCKSLARQAFANPVVEVKEVKVTGMGISGGSLDLVLDVYNPNEYRLDASRITYAVWVDTSQVANGAIDRIVTLAQRGRSDIVVPVDFTYAAVLTALARMAERGSVDYRVMGQFTVVTPFGNVTRPYSGSGRLDAFR